MEEKQLFVKPMLVELNKTTGENMEEKNILEIALEYGDIKFKLGELATLKSLGKSDCADTKEYDDLNRRRFELLDELYDAYYVN